MRRSAFIIATLMSLLIPPSPNAGATDVPQHCAPLPNYPDTPGLCLPIHKVDVTAVYFPLHPSELIIDATNLPSAYGTARWADYANGSPFGPTLINLDLTCVAIDAAYNPDLTNPHTVSARGTTKTGETHYLIATTNATGFNTRFTYTVTRTRGTGRCGAPTPTVATTGDFHVIP